MTFQEFYNIVRFKYGTFFRAVISLRSRFKETKTINHKLTIRRIF